MFCRYCGQRLKGDDEYCPNCGGRVEKEELRASDAAPGGVSYDAPDAGAGTAGRYDGPSPAGVEGGPGGAPAPGAGYSAGGRGYSCGPQTPGYGAAGPGYAGQGYGAPVYGAPRYGNRVSAYYAREFADIAAGGRGRFNVAAFFLGPFHQMYRGCGRRFVRTYLPLWAVLWVWIWALLGMMGQLARELVAYSGITPEPAPALYVWVICLLVSYVALMIWSIALSIYNGVTFNRKYYEQMMGDPAVPGRAGPVVGLIGAQLALYVVTLVVFAISIVVPMMQQEAALPYDSGYGYSEDEAQAGVTYGPEHYGDRVADILAAWDGGSDQSIVNGYIPESALGGTLEERAAASYMFYSDARALGTLLGNVEDAQWYCGYEADEDGTEYAELSWLEGDTVVTYVFAVNGTYIWVVDAWTCLLAEDPSEAGYYSLWDSERCALLMELYGGEAQDDASLAREMRGTWTDSTGETLVLDADFFGDTYYTLGTMLDGGVQCWVETDGSYVVFSLDESRSTLTARWFGPDAVLEAEQVCTRAA